jgi:phage terminase Nu1 subunit (DNA packaging protein)
MTDESREKPTKSASRPKKITQEALAKHLCLERGSRSVRELFERGVLPGDIDRANLTTDDLDKCREAYILHLRAAAAGRSEKEDDEPLDESKDPDVQLALLRQEQILLARIKRRKTLGQLVERAVMRLAVSAAFMRVRTVLLKIPKKHAPSLAKISDPVKSREYLDDIINEALSELASTPVESIGREADADEIELDEA